jgi:SOS response regulatory protein OraA/RecX
MKIDAEKYLFNKAVTYLGKYPATKNKIKEYLQKKIKNKKIYQKAIFPENLSKDIIIENIISRLDELKIINESNYLESMFNYYIQSLFSLKKIKNKLYQKGFDKKDIDEFVSSQLQENPDLETHILKKYIQKKNISNLDIFDLKKKLYQQSFTERSIYKIIKE